MGNKLVCKKKEQPGSKEMIPLERNVESKGGFHGFHFGWTYCTLHRFPLWVLYGLSKKIGLTWLLQKTWLGLRNCWRFVCDAWNACRWNPNGAEFSDIPDVSDTESSSGDFRRRLSPRTQSEEV